jgi:AcrR family transcriptional regulator
MGVQTHDITLMDRALELFMRGGVRSVTMDDVASDLGVSKKTLYKYFPSKKALVLSAVKRHIGCDQEEVEKIRDLADNAIDEVLRITQFVHGQIVRMNPAVVVETKKYFRESWQLFDEFRHEFIYRQITDNIQRGISEGLYRSEIIPEIIAKLYVGKMDMFFDPILFPPTEFNLAEVYEQYMDHHIRGMASEKGIAYLEKRKNRDENGESD